MSTLFDRRLVVIAGKGGVGRTTVAAAFAAAAARRGKRVLLAQAKSKERLGKLLGGPPVAPGGEIVRVRERLWAVNITPEAALREYGLMVLRSSLVYRAVFENRVARAFIRAIPGVEDYSIIGKVWFHTTEQEHGRPRFDLTVLDAPATGHVVTLLQIPQAILDAVPEGPLTTTAQAARELLLDRRRCLVTLVTLAEDLPVNETIELAAALRTKVGVGLGPLVVNQLYPPRFATGPSAQVLAALPETVSGDAALGPLVARARIAQRRREMHERYLARLAADVALPEAQLPYVFRADFGADALEDLSQRLEGQIAQLPVE